MREKLIELVGQVQDCGCDVTDVVEMNYVENITLVDHLIANGVVVQEWISVKDRLPEQYHSVIVWTSDEELGEAAHDGKQFRWAYDDEYANVTHWMEMPQPPKGE